MKTVLYIATTLNGYIATTKDDAPWSMEVFENYYTYIKQTGNIIVGRRTYEIMKDVGEFAELGNPFTVVVTSQNIFKNTEKTRFVPSIKQALREVEDMGFTTAVIGGGSQLNTSALKAGVIDEIEIDIEPFIFSNGIPLFESSDIQLNLRLIGTTKINANTLHVQYQVIKLH